MVRQTKARLKGILRRQRDLRFPDRATREYRAWMKLHMSQRAKLYENSLEPGLLSIITAVWDGSPLDYFQELAQSIAEQMEGTRTEWFIVANGCSRPDLLEFLRQLSKEEYVKVHYLSANIGIVKGLRLCLERAVGRYVLPVDADDKLYPDALRIVTAHIQRYGYPALLYTDEDKVSGSGIYQPYFKPDWDSVLLANSAYIAHLGVADRNLALQLGAYGDIEAEGSADWDLFTRFANAGYSAIHIPEVVYSWRIHADSTADDDAAKPYIKSSQEAVMRRFLNRQPSGKNFAIETNALFGPDAAHLRCKRLNMSLWPLLMLNNATDFESLRAAAEIMGGKAGIVGLSSGAPGVADPDAFQEAVGLFELFPDTVMVGGRLSNASGMIVQGARYFGFNGACGCPDAGRKVLDPGYFGQMWKQRSVSAVSTELAFIRAADLVSILERLPREATVGNLGCWIGAEARRDGRRIVYSPFLHARHSNAPIAHINFAEEQAFRARYADLLPDRRFYPEPLSLEDGYRIATAKSRFQE